MMIRRSISSPTPQLLVLIGIISTALAMYVGVGVGFGGRVSNPPQPVSRRCCPSTDRYASLQSLDNRHRPILQQRRRILPLLVPLSAIHERISYVSAQDEAIVDPNRTPLQIFDQRIDQRISIAEQVARVMEESDEKGFFTYRSRNEENRKSSALGGNLPMPLITVDDLRRMVTTATASSPNSEDIMRKERSRFISNIQESGMNCFLLDLSSTASSSLLTTTNTTTGGHGAVTDTETSVINPDSPRAVVQSLWNFVEYLFTTATDDSYWRHQIIARSGRGLQKINNTNCNNNITYQSLLVQSQTMSSTDMSSSPITDDDDGGGGGGGGDHHILQSDSQTTTATIPSAINPMNESVPRSEMSPVGYHFIQISSATARATTTTKINCHHDHKLDHDLVELKGVPEQVGTMGYQILQKAYQLLSQLAIDASLLFLMQGSLSLAKNRLQTNNASHILRHLVLRNILSEPDHSNNNNNDGKSINTNDNTVVIGSNGREDTTMIQTHSPWILSGTYHRLLRYLPVPTDKVRAETLGSHCDWTLVTIIPVSSIPGLQIWNDRTREWVAVEHPQWYRHSHSRSYGQSSPTSTATLSSDWHSQYCIVMIGKWMELITGGTLESCIHRVVGYGEQSANTTHDIGTRTKTRYSVPFFLRPRESLFAAVESFRINQEHNNGSSEDGDGSAAIEALREYVVDLVASGSIHTNKTE